LALVRVEAAAAEPVAQGVDSALALDACLTM